MMEEGLSLGPIRHQPAQPSVLFPDLEELLVDLLVDPRHPDEPGGPDLLEGLDQRALEGVLVSEPDGGAAVEAEVDIDDLGRDVAEGEVGDTVLLVVVPLPHLLTRLDDPGDVILGQEHSFRII